jgi:hypothetical protein
MLSLRSLAFILCSAKRRARALSCAALHSFPVDRIKGRKMATNVATSTATSLAASMCGLLRTVYASQGDHGSGSIVAFFRTGALGAFCSLTLSERFRLRRDYRLERMIAALVNSGEQGCVEQAVRTEPAFGMME